MVYTIQEQTLTNIADAIREKTGDTEPIQVGNFADKIGEIETGGELPLSYILQTYDEAGEQCDVVGIEKLGNYAFYKNTSLISVDISNTTTALGTYCFYGCKNLHTINLPETITEIGYDCFYQSGIQLTQLPRNIVTIGSSAFYGCQGLTLTNLPENLTEVPEQAFYYSGVALTSLPERLTEIGRSAFQYCTKMEGSITIPENVKVIDQSAFSGTKLVTVTFKGTPESIAVNSFLRLSGGEYVKTFNVPWAEGEVANAPWGATNATINYNYTEDAE